MICPNTTESLKNNKKSIDEISRETQRLVSESHVCLPYHKPKQKSLKDFLNRSKNSSECQVTLTGPKKCLQNVWEFIENKEKNVEKFYNEDSNQNEDNTNLLFSNNNVQDKKTISIDVDDGNSCDEELLSEEKNEIIQSKIGDNNKNNEQNSIVENDDDDDDDNVDDYGDDDDDDDDDDDYDEKDDDEKDDDDIDDDNDEKKYFSSTFNLLAKTSPTQQIITHQNNDNSNNSEKHADCENIIDKKDESTDNMNTQFIKNLDDKQNISNNESDDEEDFSIKKKSKLITLSESSDDEDDESNTKMKSTSNDFKALFNESQSKFSTQQLMNLCSGEFKTQQSEDNDQCVDDNFDSEVLLDDFDNSSNENDIKTEEIPKLISMKDFFDEEAEVSESDWSSDDEDNLVNNDKLEEEDGDKDNIDNDIVKDELDKIFRRQLLDDDQGQVNVLKEMLLEDGDLYSDSTRKRKFQWNETDEKYTAFKKPLFSDDEDDYDTNDCDTIEEQWRKDRFERESYLFKKNNCEEQFDKDNVSSDISPTSISAVKKTRIVKYQKEEGKNISNENKFDEDKNSSTAIIVTNNTTEKNITNSNDFTNPPAANMVMSKLSKTLKGSFMKYSNSNMMKTAQLYINQKISIIDNENINRKFEKKSKKLLTTNIAKATNNDPFTYLLRNDKKQEINNLASIDMMNDEKKEHDKRFGKSFASAESTQQLHETKSQNPFDCILKQLK